jgi:hypothetical protein
MNTQSHLEAFKLSLRVYHKILENPVLAVEILRLLENIPTNPVIDEESLRKFAIANAVLAVSASYQRAKADERVEVQSIGDELHVTQSLIELFTRLGVELPGIDFLKPGTTEFSSVFDAHLNGNGIPIGVNRGNDEPLKLYPKPEFNGLGEK